MSQWLEPFGQESHWLSEGRQLGTHPVGEGYTAGSRGLSAGKLEAYLVATADLQTCFTNC